MRFQSEQAEQVEQVSPILSLPFPSFLIACIEERQEKERGKVKGKERVAYTRSTCAKRSREVTT
jgi:hypothetical protein